MFLLFYVYILAPNLHIYICAIQIDFWERWEVSFNSICLLCFKKNYSGVPLLVCVTVVVSLKWLAVPIMTSQSKTTAKEFLKPSYNVQRESLDMTNKSQKF